MKRIMFDTNVYGHLLLDNKKEQIIVSIKNKNLLIYGNKIIRDELRSISKKTIESRKVRISLLTLYDELVKVSYPIKKEDLKIAENYHYIYTKLGGKRTFKELKNDFIIIANAHKHGIDLVVSDDEKTIASPIAKETYKIVHKIRNELNVSIKTLYEFKRWIL